MLTLIILFSVLFVSEASIVNKLVKCDMYDSACHKKLYQTIISDIGKTGITELGIPPIDPLELKNVSVSVLGILDISLQDGVAKGVKDCVIHNATTDIPNGHLYMEMTCDTTVKGHYKAFSSSPLVRALFGADFIRGDGTGKVRVEKAHMYFDFTIYVHKDADGEVYLSGIYNKTKYDFEILGKVQFAGNNVFVGNEDISKEVIGMLNQSGKNLAPLIGRTFMDKTLEFVYAYTGRFFEVVPARYYIKNDLTPFIKS